MHTHTHKSILPTGVITILLDLMWYSLPLFVLSDVTLLNNFYFHRAQRPYTAVPVAAYFFYIIPLLLNRIIIITNLVVTVKIYRYSPSLGAKY